MQDLEGEVPYGRMAEYQATKDLVASALGDSTLVQPRGGRRSLPVKVGAWYGYRR